jgi:6-phosphogluconolactonase
MRSFLTLILSLGSSMSLRADTFVYVSMAPEQQIQIYRLAPVGGKLTAVGARTVGGAPGALAVDPRKKLLFASLRTNSTLASFRISPETGTLKPLGAAPLPKGEDAVYVGTDRTGRWLLAASFLQASATRAAADLRARSWAACPGSAGGSARAASSATVSG